MASPGRSEETEILEFVGRPVFLQGLKESMRERVSTVPNLLLEHSRRLRQSLQRHNPIFAEVPLKLLAEACLDEGLSNRPEFRLPCRGNGRLAYVGDAFLSLQVAELSLEADRSPKEHQAERTRVTQKTALAALYDRLFPGEKSLPLTWEFFLNGTPPTAQQKTEFFEALLGVLWRSERQKPLALFLCRLALGLRP